MESVNFNIEYIDGAVIFVRKNRQSKKTALEKKRKIIPTQTLKVECFDSKQIEIIMELQRGYVEQLKTQKRFIRAFWKKTYIKKKNL